MKKAEKMLEHSCDNCKHEDKAATEFPCSCCIHNATDKFEPKPKETNCWTLCSEGLPEDTDEEYYTTVILSLSDGKTVAGCYRNIDKEWWGDVTDGCYRKIPTEDVIAWMPLPEPYKEGMSRE